MAHGFSAVKEMYLDRFAEVFAAAGLNVLVFDNRCFGASDGEPRQEIDPWAQVRDYRDAITYLHTLPEVDPGRIGIWGSSYSGGHVLVVAAIDRRVKAVVSQVPLISGHANLPWISPTPLLLLVAVGDHLVPSELAIAAFDTAHQPKELIILPGGHFDAYTVGFEASSGPARDWFLRHLGG
jgi:cephalosporin-C deacetylase-like acetyl esterase